MGWDSRGYYYRARKVAGRVVREYVGAGPVAVLAARLDAAERARRQAEADTRRWQKADLAVLNTLVAEVATTADLLTHAALLAAGYHRHHRGEWRRRRRA